MTWWMNLTASLAVLLCLTTTTTTPCHGANILFFQPYGSMSHTYSMLPAMEGLASRGRHNVTFLGMFIPPKFEGRTNMVPLQSTLDWYEIENPNMLDFFGFNLTFLRYWTEVMPKGLCKNLLVDDGFLRVVNDKSTKYDVIIIDPLLSECGLTLVWLLGNPPFIYFCTTSLYTLHAIMLDIPSPSSYVPMNFTPFSDRMTFLQRLITLLAHAYALVVHEYSYIPAMEAIVRQKYPDVPSLSTIERNASFVFSNSYAPAFDFPRPLAPFYAEVGGIHCRPAKPLPKDIEDFIQGSGQHGFIYFSLGSNVKGTHLSPDKINLFLKAFSRLKQRVIWKFEEKLEGLPANVRTYKWLSQQDLLGHPKLKVFITQGGQLSTQEAIYHGAPILGIPIIGEQVANIRNAVSKGMGEELEFPSLDEDAVHDALFKISNNASYKENCRLQSKRMNDRPMDAIDTIVYWVGYVIRNKGAHHLRLNPSGLNFFQYFLLDVVAAIFITLFVIAFVLFKVLQLVYRVIRGGRSSKSSKAARGGSKKLQ